MIKNFESISDYLDSKVIEFNSRSFILNDPISIPHQFSKKEDIEIAGFLAATISWGQRKTIVKNANKLVLLMDNAPHDFILNFASNDLKSFNKFTHRTFNGTDCVFFLKSLQNIYKIHSGLESVFSTGINSEDLDIKNAIINFRKVFFKIKYPLRTTKHVSDPEKNSSSKRLCMFLRWMVRRDNNGVDFGIWKKINPAKLCLPLDVHTGAVSRQLGLLTRVQNDWKAVMEVTEILRKMDANDPIKYDFALFGIGESGELK